jgi:hypothetical protein
MFYISLYNYLYGDEDSDIHASMEYRLRRHTKYDLLLKYSNYCEYLNEKEKINILQDNYEYETKCFKNSLSYIKVLKEKSERLIDIREKVIVAFKFSRLSISRILLTLRTMPPTAKFTN